MAGRSGQQCAQRWRHKVNPEIRKDKWTVEEDAKVLPPLQQPHVNQKPTQLETAARLI
jgi:myb proto-oncogene protein